LYIVELVPALSKTIVQKLVKEAGKGKPYPHNQLILEIAEDNLANPNTDGNMVDLTAPAIVGSRC